MSFLDPTAEFDPEVRLYRTALERFGQLLERGDLGPLPPPRTDLGPIRFVQVSRALREDGAKVLGQVKKHVIYLLKGDPNLEPELRYNFDLVLLLDVFGMEERDCDRYEQLLYERLWN